MYEEGKRGYNKMRFEKVKIKITDRCDRNCRFCVFNNQSIDLSLEQFKKMLHVIKPLDFGKLHINGGEPLLNPTFKEMILYAREVFPDKIFVLGSNLVRLERRKDLIVFIRDYFQEICIGCDLEHRNIDIVEKVVPILCKNKNMTIVLNSIIEYTDEAFKARVEELHKRWNVICVKNHIYHTKSGKPINSLSKGLCANQNKVLMIQENGDYYRCFNCAIPDDKEGNIFGSDFSDNICRPRTTHFSFCPWCKGYE